MRRSHHPRANRCSSAAIRKSFHSSARYLMYATSCLAQCPRTTLCSRKVAKCLRSRAQRMSPRYPELRATCPRYTRCRWRTARVRWLLLLRAMNASGPIFAIRHIRHHDCSLVAARSLVASSRCSSWLRSTLCFNCRASSIPRVRDVWFAFPALGLSSAVFLSFSSRAISSSAFRFSFSCCVSTSSPARSLPLKLSSFLTALGSANVFRSIAPASAEARSSGMCVSGPR
mmetsp:Transcript_24914/g.59355  ORF Transcript_24914/g.59355 Transcript_24914/m.59355 type:complete len:229 (-) Transcript_24914:75-761(-)